MYLALDLETTGLDPEYDRILEVAWTWLNDDLQQSKPVESIVVTPDKDLELLSIDPVVVEMHSKSGLAKALYEPLTLILSDIEDIILKDIQDHMDKRSDIILFGMGPQFDRKFIDAYMPRLARKLHYRHYDVRTLTAFFDNLGVEHGVVNLNKHRAGPDVSESIAIAQFYRESVQSDLLVIENYRGF